MPNEELDEHEGENGAATEMAMVATSPLPPQPPTSADKDKVEEEDDDAEDDDQEQKNSLSSVDLARIELLVAQKTALKPGKGQGLIFFLTILTTTSCFCRPMVTTQATPLHRNGLHGDAGAVRASLQPLRGHRVDGEKRQKRNSIFH